MNFDARRIVFYDVDCGLCNRSVAFVLKYEKDNSILFASIESQFTRDFFENHRWDAPDLSTFYFYQDGILNSKSTAALKLSRHLKFPHSLLCVFWVVPRFVRDAVYNFIALRRTRIAKGYCLMPTPETRKRFLD